MSTAHNTGGTAGGAGYTTEYLRLNDLDKNGQPIPMSVGPRTVSDLLAERSVTHGAFQSNAQIGQALRELFRRRDTWSAMPMEHREALDYIAGKLSRILSGQSDFADHWADIAGFAELARKACTR